MAAFFAFHAYSICVGLTGSEQHAALQGRRRRAESVGPGRRRRAAAATLRQRWREVLAPASIFANVPLPPPPSDGRPGAAS